MNFKIIVFIVYSVLGLVHADELNIKDRTECHGRNVSVLVQEMNGEERLLVKRRNQHYSYTGCEQKVLSKHSLYRCREDIGMRRMQFEINTDKTKGSVRFGSLGFKRKLHCRMLDTQKPNPNL